MSLAFKEIHMGMRLQHFMMRAKHGHGLGAFSKFCGRGSSSIIGLYKSKSLDLDIIECACVHFEVSLPEFLGINPEDLPEPFKINGGKDETTLEKKINRIDKNVNMILDHLRKK